MALKLMYITNRPEVAQIAESAGVDRIFVDMEYIGKAKRQGGMDTVQSHHTVQDVKNIRAALHRAELLVRVNPIHEAAADCSGSAEEIEEIIAAGADIVMLPYFTTAQEVRRFVELVDGRAKTLPLLESARGLDALDEILDIPGIDEMFIGLNDLSLDLGKKFMFSLLADGTVEGLCRRFREKDLPYGFGGIAALGQGMLPAEHIIREHYRLGSGCAILSRSFCNADKIGSLGKIQEIFETGLRGIRELEAECRQNICQGNDSYFLENQRILQEKTGLVLESLS